MKLKYVKKVEENEELPKLSEFSFALFPWIHWFMIFGTQGLLFGQRFFWIGRWWGFVVIYLLSLMWCDSLLHHSRQHVWLFGYTFWPTIPHPFIQIWVRTKKDMQTSMGSKWPIYEELLSKNIGTVLPNILWHFRFNLVLLLCLNEIKKNCQYKR